MRSSDIRAQFLDHFRQQGHTVVPSSSLIPHNDPSLFFVNAGMVQFKDVFTGQDVRDYRRAATVQKCLRVSGKHNDLENVGRTPRHHTFFEMLGNFSFGDYFKAEAIPMAWSLLTDRFGIDADRLWITIFEEDDEAFALWRDLVGVPERRIQRLGVKDNFWSMGDTGPCGPCTEIHYDHGPAVSDDTRGPAGGNDRYVEIWNLVFMQYDQAPGGQRTPLPRPSIDTGMGLERVAAVLQGVYSNYDTDVFQPVIQQAAKLAGVRYGEHSEADVALRVIADHSRAAAFLVADGVMPSNAERGYVLRRIMRRAIRFGVKVGIQGPFLYETADRVLDAFQEAYPALKDRRDFVREVILGEEHRFGRTLDRGMKLLDSELPQAGGQLPGAVAFTLSDTFGFPLDLTQLIAAERGVSVDVPGFDAEMAAQKARGRAAWKGSGEVAIGELWHRLAQQHGATSFLGYDRTQAAATVITLLRSNAEGSLEEVSHLDAGEAGIVLLDATPFYAESGGQVGDTGRLGAFLVQDTTKASGLHLHRGVAEGPLAVGDVVEARVDQDRRDRTRRNHTATHLLHAALRQVLGDHVNQKGSLVGPDRLRFDFAHHKPLSEAELRQVEDLVNREILTNQGVESSEEDREAAVAKGAMALFGEKYDDRVRVVSVPGFSVELCGGTHVRRTGDIGALRVVSEGGIAAGVRRIEAQTGTGAVEVGRAQEAQLLGAARQLKTSPERLTEAISRLLDERRQLEKELGAARDELAKAAAQQLVAQAQEVGGAKVLAARFDGDLKAQADRLRDQLGSSVVILIGQEQDKVSLVVAASKDLAGKKVHAGNLVKQLAPLVGGNGGGRPDLATAGGKDAAGIDQALAQGLSLVLAALSA